MTNRRFTEAEVAAIFERATEAQQSSRRQAAPGEGMTLAEVQDIAHEVGISPDLIAEAALAIDHSGRSASRTLFGLPLGVERTVEGRHALLLNFATGAEQVCTFRDLARLKARQPGLVVAPHPFFPGNVCLGRELDRYAHLFDAVECNAMYARGANFNRRAERWARRQGKPLVGNCDVHRLWQLGSTYSLVDAAPDADAICAAIAAGRVRVESRPLSWMDVARVMAMMLLGDAEPGSVRDRFGRLEVDDQRV
jgi:hypothetical protein